MLTAQNLTKTFEGSKALDGVCFEIDDGCVYGLVGSNGSGKSTLLRCISGVYKPDDGRVGIDGIPSFNNPSVKSQIAFLGDTPYFLPQSNLKEMASFYKSTYKNFDIDTYKYLLSVFPLNESARLSTFSKGMRRQAALILMLSTKPRYLLLDEAFDGLDVVMRKTLSNIIIDSTEKYGMTVIIASHNLREIDGYFACHESYFFAPIADLFRQRSRMKQGFCRDASDVQTCSAKMFFFNECYGSA